MKKVSGLTLDLSLTLSLSVGTLLAFQSKDLAVFYVIYYALSFLVLRSFHYGADFFLSFDQGAAKVPQAPILVAGVEISTGVQENVKEERFLDTFENKKRLTRKIASWVFFVVSVLCLRYFYDIEFSIRTLIPIISCFLIINSLYVGHFLVALLLNIVMVVYYYSPDVSWIFYGVYSFLFLGSLFMISHSKESVLGSLMKSALDKKKWVSLLLLSLGLMAGISGVIFFMPDEKERLQEKALQEQKKSSLERLISSKRSELMDMQQGLKSLPPMPGLGDIELGLQKDLDRLKDMESRMDQPSFGPLDKGELKNLMNEISSHQENLSKNVENLIKSDALSTASEVEKDNFSKIKSSSSPEEDLLEDKKSPLSDEEKNSLRGYLKRTADEMKKAGATPADIKKLEEQINQIHQLADSPSLDKFQKKELAGSVEEMVKEQDTKFKEKLLSGLPKNAPHPQGDQRIEEILAPELENEKSLLEKLKAMIFILGSACILFFVMGRFRKKGIITIEGQDPSVLPDLRDKWRALKDQKFTPREEVIHHYNLFHECLQKIDYPSHETPPSCIVYEDLQESNPDLTRASYILTEVYAQCFYGDKAVPAEALDLFRKSFSRVLKTYKIT